jgi:hypothetical protein
MHRQHISDGAGNFALINLSAMCVGPQLVGYNGTTVTSPAGKYAGVNIVYTLVLDQVTASPVLVHLPRNDTAEAFYVTQKTPPPRMYKEADGPGHTSCALFDNVTAPTCVRFDCSPPRQSVEINHSSRVTNRKI